MAGDDLATLPLPLVVAILARWDERRLNEVIKQQFYGRLSNR